MMRPPPRSTLFPYTTLSRSPRHEPERVVPVAADLEALLAGAVGDAELDALALGQRPRQEAPLQLRSEEHTSELQSRQYLVCRLLLEKKKMYDIVTVYTHDRH